MLTERGDVIERKIFTAFISWRPLWGTFIQLITDEQNFHSACNEIGNLPFGESPFDVNHSRVDMHMVDILHLARYIEILE